MHVKGIIIKYGIFLLIFPIFCVILVISIPISIYKSKLIKSRKIKPKIIWGPVPVINIKYNSDAVRRYGYISNTLVYDVSHINNWDDFDYVIRPKNLNIIYRLLMLVRPYFVFLWLLCNYDIFHFFFDCGYLAHTPLKWIEFPLLKLSGKKIIVSPYGSDVIMPSKVKNKYKWNVALFMEGDENYSDINEDDVLRNIQYSTKYADYIIGAGDLVEYLIRYDQCLHYVSIDLAKWKPAYKTTNKVVRIVHAPNHRTLKGTQYLIDACDELKKEGYKIDLVIVEGMPNESAKKIYEQADIIADQFLVGCYGLFAIEGMTLGKPIMCYLRENLYEANKHWYDCPIVNTNPDNLRENLIKLIEDPELRVELGKRGRKYVEKYHSMDYIGMNMDKIYRRLWFNEVI